MYLETPPRSKPGRAVPHASSADPIATSLESSGDASFGSVVTPHLPAMQRAAQSILGSEDLAWDAVQETLLRLWVSGFLPEEPGGALVHLTVKSSLHQLRCQRRRNYHESRETELGGPCCEEDPFEQLEGSERAEAVREAIQGLADEYRHVLELYDLEGESYAEIAGRLDVPIGTVRSRLHRGRTLLRERLHASNHDA